MSTTVDSRVVEMRFDNQQFEKNVSTTMSTLDKLKRSLNFTGASKGLEEIGLASEKIDFSGMTQSIGSVTAKFSALEVMAVTALANITNSAVNAGKRLVASLSVDQITAGWGKFGSKTTSVATLTSQGHDLKTVNDQLDRLNWFTDETSYNFTDMVSNIAKFTATGKGLEESVTAMEGIANWAALSGQNATTASHAMYQISQAMGAGVMRLEDYKSIQNASMDTDEFRQKCLDAAVALGTLQKNADGTYKSLVGGGDAFNKSQFTTQLTEGAWFTSDVMMSVFNDYSEAVDAIYKVTEEKGMLASEVLDQIHERADELKTGSMSDEEAIDAAIKDLGYTLEDGSLMFDSFGVKAFEAAQKARTWGDAVDSVKDAVSTGWMNTFEIIFGNAEEATELFTDLANAMYDVFAGGAEARNELLQGWKELGGRDDLIESFWNIWDAISSIVTPVKEAFREIFPATTSEQLYAFTKNLKDFTSHLKLSDNTAKKLKSTFKGIFSVLSIGVDFFKAISKGAFTLVSHITSIAGGMLGITGSLGDFLTVIRNSIVEGNVFGKVVDGVVGFLVKGIDVLKEFASALKNNINLSSTFQGFLGFFKGLWDVIKGIGSALGEAFGDIGSVITKAFSNGDIFEVINSGLFASILLAIRNFIKGITGEVEELNFLDQIKGISGQIKEILGGVEDSLKSWQQNIQAGTLLKIAGAIGILAAALFVISGIDGDKLGSALGSIGVLMGELIGAMALMGKLNDENVKPLSGIVGSLANISRTIQMIGLTAAVVILAGAMKIIAGLDWNGIKKGLAGVTGLVVILVAAARLMNTESKSITKFAGQMVIMSVAIAALALVAKYLSSMSWEELGKGGAGILGIVAMLVGAAKVMDSNDKAITKFAGQMLIMSAAIAILAKVGKSIASMSWGELAKAGSGILGLVIILVAAAKVMDSNDKAITKFGGQMLLMVASLAILAPVLKSLGSMRLENIIKGLAAIGGALFILSFSLKAMNGSLSGSAALLVAASALAILAPAIKTLGSLSVGSIFKSLVTLAVAFGVIGVAGYLLTPLIPAILGLAGAFALFGIATLGIGAGLTLIAAGFTALATAGVAGATAFVAALSVIVTGVLGLVPKIAQIIGEGIVEIARVIGDYAPQLAESFLKLIAGVLDSLATYAPQIVDSLLTFFIEVLNSLTDHIPELIQAAMNFIGALFQGIVDTLNGIDTSNLLKGVLAVGIMTALMYALSGVVALIPSAMAGMLGVGAVIAEMAIVLAAVGALAQIPGLSWLIGEGGNLLQKIGTAIGQFIGGIAGGLMQGITSSLPAVASDLSTFMQNIKPFIEGAKSIDPSMMDGVQSLAKTILLLTAADIVNGIASFLTGRNSLSDFAKQLAPFGEGLKAFGTSVAGVDSGAIAASASAAKALVEVANAIPSEGGLWGLLAGDKDLSSFGSKMVPFGLGMKLYAAAVAGINCESIVASASAAKALVAVANAIPSEGGFWGLLAGDKDLGSFGMGLVPFGLGMKLYAGAVAGLNGESIVASASAAKALVAVANAIPSEGGFWQLLTGERDLASFGAKLVPFGLGMKLYAAAVAGIDYSSIILSALAAKALVSVANAIPPDGGFWQLLTGDKNLASFGAKLVPFGMGMKLYAATVAGIDTTAVLTSASAAKALVGVVDAIPSEGGFWGLLSGDKDLGSFGQKLVPFGKGMKSYATAVSGIDYASIVASTMAARAIVSVAKSIPSEGGFWSLINGDKDLSSFGQKLVPFGKGMKSYASAVIGINTEAIVASASAAKAVVTVAKSIPSEGGLWGLITGEKDLGSFGQKLVPFGKGMKSYASAVIGINTEAITSSVPAAKAMVKVANAIPSDLSVGVGSDTIATFSARLKTFGSAMKSYAASVAGVNTGAINSSVSAAQSVVKLIKSMNGINSSGVSSFKKAVNELSTVNIAGIVKAFSGASPKLASAGSTMMDGLIKGIKSKQSAVYAAIKSMLDATSKQISTKSSAFTTAGNTLITKLAKGMTDKKSTITKALTTCLSDASAKIKGYYTSFYNAGSYLVSGFASGISANSYKAAAKARAMASAAEKAAKDELDINSPSKVFRAIGKSVPEGFAQGIDRLAYMAKDSSIAMADTAVDGLKGAISNIGAALNSDMDMQPTIRPVLDLSDVRSGAGAISGLLGNGVSLGTLSNIGAINAAMGQNGKGEDVVGAIDKLRKDLNNIGGTSYTINGVSYDGESGVADAIKTIARAAIRERRI